jgi:formylglycine-generating enzyme required for sulfatase activity
MLNKPTLEDLMPDLQNRPFSCPSACFLALVLGLFPLACAGQPEAAPAASPAKEPPDPAPEQPASPAQAGDDAGAGAGAEQGFPQVIPCETAPPEMACIPGGPFIRGSDDGPKDTRPRATVWLQTFYMDLNELTYGQYEECMKTQGCPRARPNYSDFDDPRQPMTGVSWYDSLEYCRIQGKTLPTEAQWEKAARGTDGRLHPWGDEPATCERAVIMDRRGRSCGVEKKGKRPDKGKPLPVGSRPAFLYGLFDMSGNSWEWVIDWHSKSYEKCGKACRFPLRRHGRAGPRPGKMTNTLAHNPTDAYSSCSYLLCVL